MTKLVPFQATIQDDDTGAAIVSPVVTVRVGGPTGDLADLFDIDGVATVNPITGGTDGFVQFQARPGKYWIQAADGGTFSSAWYDDFMPESGLSWETFSEMASDVSAGMVLPSGTLAGSGGLTWMVIPAGHSLYGTDPISALPGWMPVGDVSLGHFGDNVTPLTTDMTSAFGELVDYAEAQTGGCMMHLDSRALVTSTITIEADNIFLVGTNPSGYNTGGSEIRGGNTIGPVIRWKGRFGGVTNFIITATNARRTATNVTRDNYASLGLTRDDQTYGLWIESDDNPGDEGADEFYLSNVTAHNQPGSSVVFMGGGYNSTFIKGVANDSLMHGLVIGDGTYTGRTNVRTGGVVSIHDWSSRGCAGHGLVVGDPTQVGLSCVRVNIYSMDNYNNASDPAKLFDDYESWAVCDNMTIIASGFSGYVPTGSNGAIAVGGRNIVVDNIRLMNVGDAQAPIKIISPHGTSLRDSDGIRIGTATLTLDGAATSPLAYLIDNTGNAAGLVVDKRTLEGNFTDLVNGDYLEATRFDKTVFNGDQVFNGAVLLGKEAEDTTTLGGYFTSDGGGASASLSRNNINLFLNRTTNGEIVRRARGSDTISFDVVHTTTAATTATTIYTLPTRSAGPVTVTGSYNDGGTIRRFADIVFFMWGQFATVIATRTENAPATRTYGVSSGSLTVSMGSDTYQVRTSGSAVTFNE